MGVNARRMAGRYNGSGLTVTERQREVWHWLATGMTNKQIARKLDLSDSTVRCHVLQVYKRNGYESRIEAAFGYAEAASVG